MGLPIFARGQRVVSPKWGVGTVREVAAGGAILRVWFDIIDGVQSVMAAELSAVEGTRAQPEPAGMPAPGRRVIAATDRATANRPSPVEPVALPEVAPGSALDGKRLAVECLRQGLPPPRKLISFTVGHKNARNRIDTAIARAIQGQGSTVVVKADYGQGKSHWGRMARELALEQGLLTMHVELDGDGLSLGRTTTSTRVLATLFSSMALPIAEDEEDGHLVPGLGTLLRRAAGVLAGRVPRKLKAFEPFLRRADELVESEELVELVEAYLSGELSRGMAVYALRELIGERIYLQPLGLSYGSTGERRGAQVRLLSNVVELGIEAGAKGALIVLDEIDHDLQDRPEEVLNMLGRLAGLARDNPIVMVMLTPSELGLSVKGAVEVKLEPLDPAQLNALMRKTIDTFASAFPATALERGREELMDALLLKYEGDFRDAGWGPRFFVRSTIEACEAARHQKLDSLAEVEIA